MEERRGLSVAFLQNISSVWDSPGGPVAKILGSQYRGSSFNPWSVNLIPHATAKTWCSQINKYFKNMSSILTTFLNQFEIWIYKEIEIHRERIVLEKYDTSINIVCEPIVLEALACEKGNLSLSEPLEEKTQGGGHIWFWVARLRNVTPEAPFCLKHLSLGRKNVTILLLRRNQKQK